MDTSTEVVLKEAMEPVDRQYHGGLFLSGIILYDDTGSAQDRNQWRNVVCNLGCQRAESKIFVAKTSSKSNLHTQLTPFNKYSVV